MDDPIGDQLSRKLSTPMYIGPKKGWIAYMKYKLNVWIIVNFFVNKLPH